MSDGLRFKDKFGFEPYNPDETTPSRTKPGRGDSMRTAGDKVGSLELLEFAKRTNGGSWRVRCACGAIFWLCECELRHKRSCGCKQFLANVTHGLSKSPEYRIYAGVLQRCFNPNKTEYPYYGGRGITVCERWLGIHGFGNFILDMGRRPSATHSLDRKESDGDYSPDNCKWATPLEQYANRKWRYMTLRQYQHMASKTATYPGRGGLVGLVYTALGMSGEVGEVANKVKKLMRGDSSFEVSAERKRAIIEEAGGVLWYLSQLAEELGVTLDDIARLNLKSLQGRAERGTIHGDGDER